MLTLALLSGPVKQEPRCALIRQPGNRAKRRKLKLKLPKNAAKNVAECDAARFRSGFAIAIGPHMQQRMKLEKKRLPRSA